MAEHAYEIVFTADTSQAIAGMKQVETAFRQLDAAVNGSAPGLDQMKAQLRDIDAAACGAAVALDGAAGGGRNLSMSLGELGKAFAVQAVMQGAVEAIGEFIDRADKAREHIDQLTERTMKFRGEMTEVAHLQKHDGPDNAVLGGALEVAAESGTMPEQVVKYLEKFEGSIPAARQKKHIGKGDASTEAEKRAIEHEMVVQGAIFGNRTGLKGGTAGEMMGLIGLYEHVPDARSAMRTMGRIGAGLDDGKDNADALFKGLIKTAGSVVGEKGAPIGSLEELAVMYGVANLSVGPLKAGTRIEEAARGLRDTTGPQGAIMSRVGIKDGMSHLDRLRKIAPEVKKADRDGIGGDTWLRRNGFNFEDSRAVAEQARNLDLIEERLKNLGQIKGEEVIDAGKRFRVDDRRGVNMDIDAQAAVRDLRIGAGNERVKMAKKVAELQLKEEGQIGGNWNALTEMAGDKLRWTGMTTREASKLGRAERNLVGESDRLGIPHEVAMQLMGRKRIADGSWSTGNEQDEKRRVEGFNRLANEVEGRGGNIYGRTPDQSKELRELIEESKKQTELLRDLRRIPQGPVRPEVMPALAPMRGAAAPKRP